MKKYVIFLICLFIPYSALAFDLISHSYCPSNQSGSVICPQAVDGFAECTYFAAQWLFELNPGTYGETCAQPDPTCSDNTLNQGETGIDCGGPCPACFVGCETTYGWVNDGTGLYQCRNISGEPTGCALNLAGPVIPDASCAGIPNPGNNDNIKNPNEDGIDCGGSNSTPCVDICKAPPAGCTGGMYTDSHQCYYDCPPPISGFCPDGYVKISGGGSLQPDGTYSELPPTCYKSTPPDQAASGITPPPEDPPVYSFDSSNTKFNDTTTTSETTSNTVNNPDGTKTTTETVTTTNRDGSQILTTTATKITTVDADGKIISIDERIEGGSGGDIAIEGAVNGVKDALDGGILTLGGKLDGVRNDVTGGTVTLGGKLDGIKGSLDTLNNKEFGTTVNLNMAPTNTILTDTKDLLNGLINNTPSNQQSIIDGVGTSTDALLTEMDNTAKGAIDQIKAEFDLQNMPVNEGITSRYKNIFPTFTSCQDLTITVFTGHTTTIPCAPFEKFKDLFSWLLYCWTVFYIFEIFFTSPKRG